MTSDPTVDLMEITDPQRTKDLREALAQIEDIVRSKDTLQHRSVAFCQEAMIYPILDALGFTARYREQAYETQDHEFLYAGNERAVLLISRTASTQAAYDEWVKTVIETEGFNGKIIVTDGIQWEVYHPSAEIPKLTFSIYEPGAFWDLFIIGKRNETI